MTVGLLVVAQFCCQNFKILLLALQRILPSAQKSQFFACMQSCTSMDYFKFGCGYLLSIVGCIFVPKIFAPSCPTPILEGGPCRPPPHDIQGIQYAMMIRVKYMFNQIWPFHQVLDLPSLYVFLEEEEEVS